MTSIYTLLPLNTYYWFYMYIYIKRTNVFALYTNNNAYTLQAGSRADMIDWISKIDQMFPIEKLKNDSL